MIDLSITPEQYKILWWEELVDEMTKTKKFFTIPELHSLAEKRTGTTFTYNNFWRSARKYAPMFNTGISEPTTNGGRPAKYYCSMRV